MKRKILAGTAKSLFGLSFLLAVGCTAVPEKKLLKFQVKEVQDVSQVERISAEKVLPDDELDLTGFAVCGDKLISTASFMSQYCLSLVDLASGESRQQLCRKGRGPGEFLSVFPLFTVADGSIIVYDSLTGKVSEVRVSGDNVGDVAHEVKLEVPLGQGTPMIMTTYKLNGGELLAYNSIQAPEEYVSIESPYYALFDYETGAEKRAFQLFDATPLAHSSEWASTTAFDLRDCVSGDKTTACFVMGTMPVFGFLDIESGKVKGFRLKGAPTFSADENRTFFAGVCAQDRFVYALYFGKTGSELGREPVTTLYKFDWSGHILKKYELEGLYRGCYATSDKLYLSKIEDDMHWGLYQLDIKKL